MKIYISTHNHGMNYGAELQSHALQSYLNELGYSSKLIDCILEPRIKKSKKISLMSYGREKISKVVHGTYNKIHRKEIEEAKEKFYAFEEKHQKFTRHYTGYEDLSNDPPIGDVYLSGSDQVFNAASLYPFFFLQFGSKEARRIAYAASVGIKSVPKENEELLRKYLLDFDCLSLRESASKPLIEKYTDKTVNVHMDPSFLMNKSHWEEIADESIANTIKGPYILLYLIYRPKWINKVLKRLKKETGCKIVLIKNRNYTPVFCDKNILNAGPSEFLGLIKNAKMVISSSFHGNVFSMIFEKPFYSVVNPDAPDRIMEIINLFEMKDRLLKEDTKFDFNIDYTDMKKKLKSEQERSKDYLISAIEGK